MNRRQLLAALTGVALGSGGFGGLRARAEVLDANHPLQPSWQAWKALCLLPEGRVVDGIQDGDSHSEGQGYGLVLAATFGDLRAADDIIGWTERNLALRGDALLAWRWRVAGTPHVPDRNNASDGDLFYCWGLVMLAARQDRPDLIQRARAIATDLLRLCVVRDVGAAGPLLLPGVQGFRTDDGYVVNPSYTMPRALREIATALGLPELLQVAASGQRLSAALAARGLVPDWILVTGAGAMAVPPARFSTAAGYESIRTPLFDAWSGNDRSPALQSYARATAEAGREGGAVTVLDAASGDVRERSSHAGYAAVAALAQCIMAEGRGSVMPVFTADQPYYPATLHLIALLAQAQFHPRCVPI